MAHDTENNQDQPDRNNDDFKKFEAEQKRETEAFEKKEEEQLKAFEHKQEEQLEAFEAKHSHRYGIKIDRIEYVVDKENLTGEQLRHVPVVAIGPDRDLFEVVPGGSDRKIQNGETVQMHDGLRFFTAPAQINPGKEERSYHAAS